MLSGRGGERLGAAREAFEPQSGATTAVSGRPGFEEGLLREGNSEGEVDDPEGLVETGQVRWG